MEPLIRVEEVSFCYPPDKQQSEQLPAGFSWTLRDINLRIMPGEYVAVIGPNGSGKSTLVQLLNGLVLPTKGKVLVGELDTRNREQVWDIRRRIGMVFQNPDNQLVGTTVEEDVAFGPENYGVERAELRARVDRALSWVDIDDLRERQPSKLSGGQKQRVAIAGALALQPLCLVLDEPTSMLDPRNRRRVLECAHRLNREQGQAIVHITHQLEECLSADRILVLDRGRIVADGSVEQVFAKTELLESLGLELPSPEAERTGSEDTERTKSKEPTLLVSKDWVDNHEPERVLIALEKVGYIYGEGHPWETAALAEVDLRIWQGEIVGLCGATGSGKTTLLHLLNGLLKPSVGKLRLFEADVWVGKTDFRELRRRIGLLFQSPEDQMFEMTVFDEVAYGPRNQGWSKDRVRQSTLTALNTVGLAGEVYAPLSPFSLSGGEKRKVALAGILAMEPEILVLDEPLAGLDGHSKRELLALLNRINRDNGITVIMVSHDLPAVARIADRIVVLNKGQKVLDIPADNIDSFQEQLDFWGLEVSGWKTYS